MANEILIPKFSATNPRNGGASKKTTNDNCDKEATLAEADLSDFWAAADTASGNKTAVPAPIKVNPSKAK